jgi:hypothetical protein
MSMKGMRELVKLELLFFFRNNPSVLDTVGGISSRLGREEAHVDYVVREFVKEGILEPVEIEGTTVYEYNNEKDRKLQRKRIKGITKEKVVEKAEGL